MPGRALTAKLSVQSVGLGLEEDPPTQTDWTESQSAAIPS